jgi:hypothetical protein
MATAQPPSDGICRNDALAGFAGQQAAPQILLDLQRASGARDIRVVQPGMMVTMEFSASRVTVWLAPGNRIERASCG